MKRAMRLITVLTAALGGLMLMAPVAGAGVVLPVGSSAARFAPTIGSPVSVSLYQGGADITDTWRPTWNPTAGADALTVYVVVNSNGVPAAAPTAVLVPPVLVSAASFTGTVNPFINPATNTLTTSAYPGRCTNYGSPTDFTADFELGAPVPITTPGGPANAFPLISRDCGGIAVLTVTVDGAPYTFVLPQDSNANGIPDVWENVFCPGNTCPTGREDGDGGPVTGTTVPSGDGFSAQDEYRGFIVSGAHVSTDPRQKNLFVHLVNPQCGAQGAPSLLGGGPVAYPTTVGASLFSGVGTLISGTQVHVLSYTPFAPNTGASAEWVDNFASYSDATGIVYSAPNGAVLDRQVNANAIYPILDAVTGLTVQKGLRVVECLDELVTSPLGAAGVGSPNGPDNAVIYTQRIVNYINNMITAGGTRAVKLFTYQYVNGVLSPVLQYTGAGTPTADDRNRIISAAIMYYVAMEVAHSTRLTPTLEGTSRTSYGYHHAPGSGSNVDQAIVAKVDKSTSGFNAFYIPSVYTSGDQGSFKLRN